MAKEIFYENEKKIVILGTEEEFSVQFRSPIELGQHRDSSPASVACMKRRVFALHRRLKTIIHRRNFDVLRSFLPPKYEYGTDDRQTLLSGLS
jgi:hypothetical protein